MEQIIRPTGIPDPVIEIVPSKNQIDHLVNEIQQRIDLRERTLVTTLTKRMAEELSNTWTGSVLNANIFTRMSILSNG